MSLAYYVVAKRAAKGLETFVNGKAMAHANEKSMARIYKTLGVRPLTDFMSQSREEVVAFFEGEGLDVPEHIPKEEWFQPEEGLVTVRALLRHLTHDPRALRGAKAILEDLREYERVLEALAKRGIQWHLAIDG